MSVIQESKADKHLCQINASEELIRLIDRKKDATGKFKEELFEEAVMQLLRPHKYQIGIGHESFVFHAPLKKAVGNKAMSFWIKISLWKKVKEVMHINQVSQKAVLYTAIYNYFILPQKEDGNEKE